MPQYINTPITISDYENNVRFQLQNVTGYISIADYESALIKAKCLVDDLKRLVEWEEPKADTKKLFKQDGHLILRFAKDAKEQIAQWLDGVEYDYAIQYAKEVDCPVFGKALDFPCIAE